MSKNDEAWSLFFKKTDTLTQIQKVGHAIVTASDLKKIAKREPRLMAKQDTLKSRPSVFKEHELAIVPIKNGVYVLFRDPEHKSFYEFSNRESNLRIEIYESDVDLHSFDTYVRDKGLTESQAIDFAFVSSLLKTFLGEQSMHLTIRGRSRSGEFQFKLPTSNHGIKVSGVQIEVDAGYETNRSICLIEAKVGRRDDFHVRQLFYPYLEWSRRSSKRIRPVFLTYTNSKYYLYEFELSSEFGELEIVQHRGFSINESPIARIDLVSLYDAIGLEPEPDGVPFPQANDLDKVVDLVMLIEGDIRTKSEIADSFEFDERQADYYANAARYLGLVDRYGSEFQLTAQGREFLGIETLASRTHFLLSQMLRRPALRQAIQHLEYRKMNVERISDHEIAGIIEANTDLSGSTPGRRASTVRSWMNWIVRYGSFERLEF